MTDLHRSGSIENTLASYWATLEMVCGEAKQHEFDNVANVGRLVAERINNGKSFWSFGCTHSALLVGETFYRAGGFVLSNPIFAPGLWPGEAPITRTSRLEKLSGYAEVLLSDLKISQDDVIVVFSTSGWNSVPVEFAQLAKEKYGATIVGITSTDYLRIRPSSDSLHLGEVCDYVIDNHIPIGDAAVALNKYPQIQMGPMSTYVGVALINGILIATAEALSELNVEPPVFRSGNVPGGMEQNLEVLDKYRDQIHYL